MGLWLIRQIKWAGMLWASLTSGRWTVRKLPWYFRFPIQGNSHLTTKVTVCKWLYLRFLTQENLEHFETKVCCLDNTLTQSITERILSHD